jgi:uracil-DNA glycosylase family 4
MSIEDQLQFDISRCSFCPLGANRLYYAPVFQPTTDIMLVLESPSLTVCEQGNPWKHPTANFLSRMLFHASGADLSRFHLTFMMKCWPQIDGATPPMRHRKAWAQECAQQYLSREVEALSCKKMILFGEFVAKACLPEVEEDWESMKMKEIHWGSVDLFCLEHPKQVQKLGLNSEFGIEYLEKLHQILGGKLNLPDAEPEANLFDIL